MALAVAAGGSGQNSGDLRCNQGNQGVGRVGVLTLIGFGEDVGGGEGLPAVNVIGDKTAAAAGKASLFW